MRHILNSVVAALRADPERTFTYVEIAFFSTWWREQDGETRAAVRRLVDAGQLSFANGGWVMHDEAAAHFTGMVDQTALGHAWLLEHLGAVPTAAWQLDPFGHSAAQASLLGASAGFDALYFGRIDRRDLELRRASRRCEGVWTASPSLGPGASVFWGLTGSYGGNYGAPHGFCLDGQCDGGDEPVVDDPMYVGGAYNAPRRVDEFVREVVAQGSRTVGNNVLLTVGEDFQVCVVAARRCRRCAHRRDCVPVSVPMRPAADTAARSTSIAALLISWSRLWFSRTKRWETILC